MFFLLLFLRWYGRSRCGTRRSTAFNAALAWLPSVTLAATESALRKVEQMESESECYGESGAIGIQRMDVVARWHEVEAGEWIEHEHRTTEQIAENRCGVGQLCRATAEHDGRHFVVELTFNVVE